MLLVVKKLIVFLVGGYFYFPYLLNKKTGVINAESRGILMSSAPLGFAIMIKVGELGWDNNTKDDPVFFLIALIGFFMAYLIFYLILIKWEVLRRLDVYFMSHMNNRYLNYIGYLYFLGLSVSTMMVTLDPALIK